MGFSFKATPTVAAATKDTVEPYLDPAWLFNLGGRAVNLTVGANFGSDGTTPS
jgi:hypothetical protein